MDIHLNPKIGADWQVRRQQKRVDLPPMINAVHVNNVRSWHGADKLTELKVRCERGADVGNCYNRLGDVTSIAEC